ncbi:hypothetical protein C0V70_03135 [Bacteriovorax stolpii]|uniref:Uncharacterized protein n=1 Tax=Bacteriovorax stolpii TaxID=960 RepID=A0A2K9NNP3_BACTC|nr:hypothetical protein [Bacteriovorax stolpii]AUN97117.1 hypothetical protein C0V70_03135 [Bacteriovorax stolpii]TDP53403.1 hypothetical protein C8D79_2046 [Bacteriovorax stolpii]
MEKKICALLFAFTFITLSSVVHGQPESVHRGPSVEPVVEVDIEDAKKVDSGYDFAKNEAPAPKRFPANIVAKADATAPSNYVGPLIFLIALPIALWIMVSKKFSKKSDEKAVGYYPKTQQFKPYKTDYQQNSEDDDDVDFPKAS